MRHAVLMLGWIACTDPPGHGRDTDAATDTGPAPTTTPPVVPVVALADEAPSFAADDVEVSSRRANVHDPEFDRAGSAVVISTPEDELWVGRYHPQTGELVPPDVRGVLVDTDVAPWEVVTNGPEWAQGLTGGVILYSKLVGADYRLMRAWFYRGSWRAAEVDGVPGRVGPIGSEDAEDPEPRVLYFDEPAAMLRWSYLDGRDGGDIAPMLRDPETPPVAPRFTRGDRSIVWAAEVDGYRQVHLLHELTGEIEVLTTDPTDKGGPFMWLAPEYGELVFFATRGDPEGAPVALDLYRHVDGRWQVVKSIVPPASHPYVVSPEPLVSGGRSLVAFQASSRPDTLLAPSQLWVAAATPEGDELRRVDGGEGATPIDPEWAEIDGAAMIYYSAFDPGERRTIRLCATGLP